MDRGLTAPAASAGRDPAIGSKVSLRRLRGSAACRPSSSRPAGRARRTAPGAADVGDFDHRARMGLGVEIGKTSLVAADLALVTDFVAKPECLVVERLVVVAPV